MDNKKAVENEWFLDEYDFRIQCLSRSFQCKEIEIALKEFMMISHNIHKYSIFATPKG